MIDFYFSIAKAKVFLGSLMPKYYDRIEKRRKKFFYVKKNLISSFLFQLTFLKNPLFHIKKMFQKVKNVTRKLPISLKIML